MGFFRRNFPNVGGIFILFLLLLCENSHIKIKHTDLIMLGITVRIKYVEISTIDMKNREFTKILNKDACCICPPVLLLRERACLINIIKYAKKAKIRKMICIDVRT